MLSSEEMPMKEADAARVKDLSSVIDRIIELFETRGQALYGGEAVSQTEHALQSAMAAEKSGARAGLVASALLHDLGHLLHQLPENAAEQGVDDHHEELACRWLARYFGPEVTEPIRLHVAAKRYLCATDANYAGQLSDASRLSLSIQGGAFTLDEVEEFRRNPYLDDAIQLRYWDDIAKIPGLKTPDLGHYRRFLEEAGRLSS